MEITLINYPKPAIIDDTDKELIDDYDNQWFRDSEGYVRVSYSTNGKNKCDNIKLHQLIWKMMGNKGSVSFKDGDRLNCRRENLKPFINGRVPVGVYRSGDKFHAIAWGKDGHGKAFRHSVGTFLTLEEAESARLNEIQKRRFNK